MAVHKPRGMLVHDGDTSLDEYVRRMLVSSLPASISFVPGPLHRLDRNTSGIIMFSKSLRGADIFSTALRFHQLQKFYCAILVGELFQFSTFSDILVRNKKQRRTTIAESGKRALLSVFPLFTAHLEDQSEDQSYTLALIHLHTGLSHQIRAQLSYHGWPLAADTKYGGKQTRELSSCTSIIKTLERCGYSSKSKELKSQGILIIK